MENTGGLKILSVGDIHGRIKWKEIDPNNYDRVIFIGDYVDSFVVDNETMLNNLADIIEFRKGYPDKVVLLIGNHDISYFVPRQRCSGFRPEMELAFQELYLNNIGHFLAAYQINDYLWTHAGVHRGWWNIFEKAFAGELERRDLESPETIADKLNMGFRLNLPCMFDVGHLRGGHQDVGGIFWCDKQELSKKPLTGIKQIVGHTGVSKVTTMGSVTFIDCLERGEFYELTI